MKWEDVREVFSTLDKDGDRAVDWEEFFVSTNIGAFFDLNGTDLKLF